MVETDHRIAVDHHRRWRNRATIVPMRVVVRIPTGHLVAENVLVPRRLGTRLNRTQPPIAITRETINVLEGGGGGTPEGGGTTLFSLPPRCISYFPPPPPFFPYFSPFSFSLLFISRIFDYRPPFLLDFFYY